MFGLIGEEKKEIGKRKRGNEAFLQEERREEEIRER